MLLRVEGVSKKFGGLTALRNINLTISDSELVGIIGPNGAGKTTLLNIISGFVQPNQGRILFNEIDITKLSANQIAQLGIARTFQQSILYMRATCIDNVLMGFLSQYKEPRWKAFLRTKAAQREEQSILLKAEDLLDFFGLLPFKNELAANLPLGIQRTLGICIALAANPKLLLLDEPFLGMNALEVQTMVAKIKQLRDDKSITVIVVEHNMKAVMSLCERVIVLSSGQKIAEGSPIDISKDKNVIEAYLGTKNGD